ncbi:helix-turn-helix domain-containing protein [Specibacter cremeus]|uniref:helix-turn-helix domain-containing protein n=1 Tax=Specibacter cremeus TaxID=1629051 RepID=UPI00197BDA43|nr:helix-turn-helix domain-containing protein [Specibacter cremeus]
MADRVRVRRLTPEEVQRLQRLVHRGAAAGGNVVRWQRATMILASAAGNSVPVIARLLAADEGTVREVIHRFNKVGLACLDPEWVGGRSRLFTSADEDLVAA